MTSIRIALHQMRYDVKAQLRNPPVVAFGLALPVLFLLIFATIFGNDTVAVEGGTIKTSTYYVPGIIALGVISTTFVNLAIGMTVQRESGLLKRLRATPLPLSGFMFGRVGVQVGFAFLITAVLMVVGRLVYDVSISVGALPELALVVLIGAGSFACMGIAFTALIPNEDSAPAVTNLVMLPLYFISGVFFPVDHAPEFVAAIASVFPVRPLAEALLAAFDVTGTAVGVPWDNLAVVLAWGVVGVIVARRYFRWVPRAS